VEGKDKDSMDMESMQRMIKRLSNEVIDMKMNNGEGTSNQRPYRPFFRRLSLLDLLNPHLQI
jgi:hypothetical protein